MKKLIYTILTVLSLPVVAMASMATVSYGACKCAPSCSQCEGKCDPCNCSDKCK